MDIMKEETFGPVLPVSTFDTLDQVIALANDCEFGLTSSVYTTNLNEAFYVTRCLQFGETRPVRQLVAVTGNMNIIKVQRKA